MDGGIQPEIWFKFNQLSSLELWQLPNLVCFYPGTHKTSWPALKKLTTYGCPKIKIFGHVESQIPKPLFVMEQVIPQLEQVSFDVGDIAMINDHHFESDFFCNIKCLHISSQVDEWNVFPFCFLQRFYNLETLEVGYCHFKELSPSQGDAGEDKDMITTLSKIKKLRLDFVTNTRLVWTQEDQIPASLESLELWHCPSLINLGSDFSTLQNLTTLDVWNCKKMTELITSSKAQSLGCLVTMRIRECETMREVVASQGDETIYEIVFKKLKHLELDCLLSLKNFCSGNHTFRFPSLELVILSQCPRMNNFCQGVLSTKKLQKVQLTKTDFKGSWARDLNATVEHLYKEQVGYRGLKHLKLSEFPELMGVWSRNPQEKLDLQSLLVLEVCDLDNLRCIFNLSTALSLGRLQQLEIKRCSHLEQVIKEEDSNTVVEEAIITDGNKIITIFPHLKCIVLESCSNMTSFYLGSAALEFPSLKRIMVADSPKMTSFVSTFSRNEDEADTFFSDKVVFPNLEKIEVSHLRNVKRLWYNQLHADSFSKLKVLEVEHCNALLNIFPFVLLQVFQKLEILTVTDCVSLKEVFQLQVHGSDIIEETNVVGCQLREVSILRCLSVKAVFPFPVAKRLLQLERLTVHNCGVEEIVSKIDGGIEPEIWFEFNHLSLLDLWSLPNLVCFYPGTHKTSWPALKKLTTYRCGKFKIFGHVESQLPKPLFLMEQVIPQLEQVSFNSSDISMINECEFEADLFCNIKCLQISSHFDKTNVFPFCFLQRFYNLETLHVVGPWSIKELSPSQGDAGEDNDMITTLPKIKNLKLDFVSNTRLVWTQEDPISASLESLQVWQCPSLINLGSYFSTLQNLTTLDVWKCKEMRELITPSKAQSLVFLVTMRIRECETMREVVASQGDETTDEIVFKKLKYLELHCLPGLKSFCSGNYSFSFPSLEQVILRQCPRMNNFCQGVLSASKLQKVQLTETDFKGSWAGDLNAMVEQLYIEQVSIE